MALQGKGMLVTFTEVPARFERDFNEWYNREHIDERVNMKGFRRARRYVASRASPKYFATYETRRVEDLADPDYMKLLANQTAWSQRVMAHFNKKTYKRLTLRIRCDLVHGEGGGVALARFVPAPEKARAMTAWFKADALPKAIALPGMLGAFLAENDLETANAPARFQGKAIPQKQDIEWLALFEAADAKTALAAAKAACAAKALKAFGVTKPAVFGSYSFQFGNQR